MAFTVDDFQDLLRLLEARPEWRTQLRRLLLPDEVMGLPTLVTRLAEAQLRAEERLSGVEERLSGVEERLSRLEEGQIRLEAALDRLAQAQEQSEVRISRVEATLDRLAQAQERSEQRLGRVEGRLAGLRGDNLERRYREHAGGYFGRLVRRVRVVGDAELDDLIEEGLAAGVFDEDGADDIRLADLVVRGRHAGDDQETFLVVEVSGVVEPADVERAARRAELLSRVRPALAVVGGEEFTPEAIDLALTRAVRRIGNGRLEPPSVD